MKHVNLVLLGFQSKLLLVPIMSRTSNDVETIELEESDLKTNFGEKNLESI